MTQNLGSCPPHPDLVAPNGKHLKFVDAQSRLVLDDGSIMQGIVHVRCGGEIDTLVCCGGRGNDTRGSRGH